MGVSFLGDGTLRDAVQVYAASIPEEMEMGVSILGDGTIKEALIPYNTAIPETIEMAVSQLGDGTIKTAVIFYVNWPKDNMQLTSLLGDGTLE